MGWVIFLVIGVAVALLWQWWRQSVPPINVPRVQPQTKSASNDLIEPNSEIKVSISTRSYESPGPFDREPEFLIEYADSDGVVTSRQIEIFSRGWKDESFRAWCFLRSEERTFRFDRVLSARNLRTGRAISDLRNYVRRNW